MTAKVIDFPGGSCRSPGNGAREALIEHASDFPNTTKEDAERWADFMLANLWAKGFKVVPLDGNEGD